MKRISQLQALSREHHASLVLANKCINTADSQDAKKIAQLCEEICTGFKEKWETHFTVEEENIFNQIDNLNEEQRLLCQQLNHEHELMRAINARFCRKDYASLKTFGEILKQHTHTEERELFPGIESSFTQNQLDQILIKSEI